MKEITITKGQFSDKSTTVVAEAIEELSKQIQDVRILLAFTLLGSLVVGKLQKEFFGEELKESEQEKEPKHDKESKDELN